MGRLFKSLLIVTGVLGVLSPLVGPYLALSWAGVQRGFVWQFVTYLFVEPRGENNFGSLLHLGFNLFLLWAFGGALLQRGKRGLFYGLYFSAGIVAGLVGVGLMALAGQGGTLAGNSPALYGVLIAWTLLHPQAKLLLFFALPFQATWLLLGLIGANLLIDLSNGHWILFCSYAGACLYSYVYSLIAWRSESWIPALRPFERFLFRLLERSGKAKTARSKIYDFKSGEPVLNDEQFMDAMLERIARHGTDSLKPSEKARMAKIAESRKEKQR